MGTGSVGRPSDFSEELADEICRRMVEDQMSLRAVCRMDDMPHVTTVLRWLSQKADFATKYAHAREALADGYVGDTIEIADTEEDAARARNRISARQWFAEKLKPKVYGTKAQLEHSGPDGGPIPTSVTVNFLPVRAKDD